MRAGLTGVPLDASVVLVHDAAHPLVRPRLLAAVVAGVRTGADAAVCVLPMTQVVHEITEGVVVRVLPKAGQVLAQSPVAFASAALRAAHAEAVESTEDVQLVVARGGRVVTVPGDPLNLHITTVEEWAMATALAPLRDRPE